MPEPASPPPFLQTLSQTFANRRIGVLLLLGFASGLPLALSAGSLQSWLAVSGVDIKTIGFFALAGLPYTFKFVWAPLLDRFEPPWAGRRRGWLVLTQLGLAGACLVMAQLDPAGQIELMGAVAVAIAFLSASQDVVFDAYRSDLLPAAERGAGAAVSVLGYRLAMLVSGGLALILADQWLGWPATYRLMAVLMAGCAAVSLFAPPVPPLVPAMLAAGTSPQPSSTVPRTGSPAMPLREPVVRAPASRELIGFAAMLATGLIVWLALRNLPWGGLETHAFGRLLVFTGCLLAAFAAAIRMARAVGFPSFVAPWDAFFARDKAVWLLALIVCYKLGDAFAGSLSTTFLIRGAGFSQTEVGAVNKVFGLIATLAGALAGGAWLARVSLYRALMVFGVLQAVSNLGYWVLSVAPRDPVLMAAAIGFENLCGGMGTAAFVAFLMALTQRQYSAAQFALLSALAAIGRVYVGPASGVLVEALGWPVFFLISVVAALPGLLLLALLRPTIESLQPENPP